MEIKAQLNKPYTEKQRMDFIVENNHNLGYKIKETETELQAWDYTEEEKRQKEREQLDSLTLTPADVERALYKAKSMDFEDLKALIAEKIPTIDLKALAIEFRAKDFYRGATIRSLEAEQRSSSDDENFQAAELPSRQSAIRLFDIVSALLGYTPDDMDYLFKNKELPAVNISNGSNSGEQAS